MRFISIFILSLIKRILQIAAVVPAVFGALFTGQVVHQGSLDDLDIVLLAHQVGETWVTLDNAYMLRLLAAFLFFVIVMTLALLSFGLVYLAKKLGQKVYDIDALALYNEIIEGRHKVFTVFLRPFYVTNKLFEQGVSAPPISPSAFLKDPNYQFEIQLVKAMRRLSPIIGLGRPGEAVGVGRILSNEEDWKTFATRMIDQAMYIICIPSSHAGSLWEIDRIVECGLLSKTFFIMPRLPPSGPFQRKKFPLEEDWANLVGELKNRGLPFPKYENRNILFCITSTSSIETREYRLSSTRSLRAGIKALLRVQRPGRQ